MARIEQLGDVRMRKIGENLPLGKKSFAQPAAIGARPQQLDRYASYYFAVHAFGQIDRTHAARSQETVQTIWSAKRTLRRESCQRVLRYVANISLESDIGAGVERQQRDNFAPYFRIDTMFLEIPIPILDRKVGDCVKGLLNPSIHTADPFSNRDCMVRVSATRRCAIAVNAQAVGHYKPGYKCESASFQRLQ